MLVVKLKFYSALHIDSKGSGEPASAQEYIHSDTLSAAIALAWAELFDEREENFFLNLPFKVSSAFPYLEDVLFFPVPNLQIWKQYSAKEYKKIKKIKWLSKKLFEDVLKGKKIDLEKVVLVCNDLVAVDSEEAQDIRDIKKGWCISERQRVKIDRLGISQEGTLFFFGLLFFSKESGLYFLADVLEEYKEKFKASVIFLGDIGIGADRNCGLGHFKVTEIKQIKFNLPNTPSGWISLSLFNPDRDEDIEKLVQNSSYELFTRSGWISHSTIGRPPVRVFSEGSFFSAKPKGRILPLLPEEIRKKYQLPIYHSAPRDFRAFVLPCVK
jgi:CRISPR-associated protein Csm4